jgi:hypothetical protein
MEMARRHLEPKRLKRSLQIPRRAEGRMLGCWSCFRYSHGMEQPCA